MFKRLLGLLALLFGAAMLLWAVGHPWLDASHRFSVGRFIGSLLMGTLFLFVGYRWLLRIVDLDALPVDPNDPRLAAAAAEAQQSLPAFRALVLQNRYDCSAKVPLRTTGGSTEHIWVTVHTVVGDQFVVSLADEPIQDLDITEARFSVSSGVLEDWQVQIDASRARGGYSIRAMRAIVEERGFRLSSQARRQLATFEETSSA
ncbi:MAG: DUF2314 domain-containing protein [Thermoanaerobaculia bacterium]